MRRGGEIGKERRFRKRERKGRRKKVNGEIERITTIWLETKNSRDCGLGKYKIMYLAFYEH